MSGSTVNFLTPKLNYYGDNTTDDLNVGTNQDVVIQRVPNYDDLTIDGTLTGNPFDGYRYGIIAFRVAGTLTGNGVISADYLGYRGGGGSYSGHPSGVDGESYGGTIGVNGGGLGGPYGNWKPHGGGGGYATVGLTNPRSGYAAAGGKSYGVPDLSKLFFGSGGGGGGTYWKDEATGNVTGLPGSDGGGIVYILADTINFSGQINARGQDGVTGYAGIAADGGSGAGGSVRIEGRNVILNTVNVLGGMVTAPGSVGRVAVYYANSFSASFTPGYLVNTNTMFVDSITSDNFESDLSNWTISAPGTSTLSTSSASAYWADKGLQVDILDNSDTYAQNNNLAAEKSYNARVYFNTDLLKIAANDVFTIFSGQTITGKSFQVQMQQTTIRQVRLLVYRTTPAA